MDSWSRQVKYLSIHFTPSPSNLTLQYFTDHLLTIGRDWVKQWNCKLFLEICKICSNKTLGLPAVALTILPPFSIFQIFVHNNLRQLQQRKWVWSPPATHMYADFYSNHVRLHDYCSWWRLDTSMGSNIIRITFNFICQTYACDLPTRAMARVMD